MKKRFTEEHVIEVLKEADGRHAGEGTVLEARFQ
jgi:hypothetical protein